MWVWRSSRSDEYECLAHSLSQIVSSLARSLATPSTMVTHRKSCGRSVSQSVSRYSPIIHHACDWNMSCEETRSIDRAATSIGSNTLRSMHACIRERTGGFCRTVAKKPARPCIRALANVACKQATARCMQTPVVGGMALHSHRSLSLPHALVVSYSYGPAHTCIHTFWPHTLRSRTSTTTTQDRHRYYYRRTTTTTVLCRCAAAAVVR